MECSNIGGTYWRFGKEFENREELESEIAFIDKMGRKCRYYR